MPACDMNGIGPLLCRPDSNLGGLPDPDSAGEEIIAVHAEGDRQIGHGGLGHRRDFNGKTGTVFERTTIEILPDIFTRCHELRNQIAMRGMDFHRVETGFAGPHSGFDKAVLGALDPVSRHGLRHDDLGVPLMHAVEEGGRRNRLLAANVEAGMAAAMADLDRGFRPFRMDGCDQLGQTGQEAVVIQSQLVVAVLADLFGCGHFNRHQPDAAACTGLKIGDGIGRHKALGIGMAGGHRCHDDAVAQLDRTQAGLLQQSGQNSCGHGGYSCRGRVRSNRQTFHEPPVILIASPVM